MMISPTQLLTRFGEGIGVAAQKTRDGLAGASAAVGGAVGATGVVMTNLTFGIGANTAQWLSRSVIPGVNSVGTGITNIVPIKKIDDVALALELTPLIAAPGGIVIGDLMAQIGGLVGLVRHNLLPLTEGWRAASHSATYLHRYGELYRWVKDNVGHWQQAIDAKGLPLFPPALKAIAAAEWLLANAPKHAFAALDAALPGKPDQETLRSAIALDLAEAPQGQGLRSPESRKWIAGLSEELHVLAQIAGVTVGAPTYLLEALGTCDKIEPYIHELAALRPGQKAPLPPLSWCLLMYARTANSHQPADGAHVPFSLQQSADAGAIADRCLVSVLGPELAKKFPGHTETLKGADNGAHKWVEMASVGQAINDSVHWG